jgi:hypothetical protein
VIAPTDDEGHGLALDVGPELGAVDWAGAVVDGGPELGAVDWAGAVLDAALLHELIARIDDARNTASAGSRGLLGPALLERCPV